MVASTSWRKADPPATPAKPKAASGVKPRTPPITHAATTATPIHAGIARRDRKSGAEAARQGNTGATAMKKSRAKPIGAVTES